MRPSFIRIVRATVGLAILSAIGATALAQPTSTPAQKSSPSPQASVGAPSLEGLEDNLPADPGPGGAPASKGTKPPSAPLNDDETTIQAYRAAKRAYYDYSKSSFEHRASVFRWQLLSSRLIFVTVILLVFAGVYFSGVQFHSSLRQQKARDALDLLAVNDPSKDDRVPDAKVNRPASASSSVASEVTQIEASLQGIKVNSPVLGVIILTISFLFFFLYLKYVYPINELF